MIWRFFVTGLQVYAVAIGIAIVAGTIAGLIIHTGNHRHHALTVRTANPDSNDTHDPRLAEQFYALINGLDNEGGAS